MLRRAAAGDTNLEIAGALGIAEETVKSHIRSVLATLDARNRTHAVVLAIHGGLID